MEARLWENKDHHADHRVLTNEFKKIHAFTDSQEKTVPLVSIDKCMENGLIQKPVVFIKIDIQGYEVAALRGMKKTIEAFHPVIAIEYSPYQVRELGYDPAELLRQISEMGYDLKVLNQDGSTKEFKSDCEKLDRPQDYVNFLCKKKLTN
jgi:uncharacterized protein YxeA